VALFTTRQKAIAIKVLMETTLVKNWALGELKAYGLDPASADGQKFLQEKRKELAERTINTVK